MQALSNKTATDLGDYKKTKHLLESVGFSSNKSLPSYVLSYLEGQSKFDHIIQEVVIGHEQSAYTSSGGDNMDDAIKTLIDRLDQDIRDHKQENRDRDSKIIIDSQEREQRYREALAEQNRMFREEAKEREDRMMAAIAEMKSDLKESFNDVKEESKTTRNTVIGLTVSVILGIAAMVIALILAK